MIIPLFKGFWTIPGGAGFLKINSQQYVSLLGGFFQPKPRSNKQPASERDNIFLKKSGVKGALMKWETGNRTDAWNSTVFFSSKNIHANRYEEQMCYQTYTFRDSPSWAYQNFKVPKFVVLKLYPKLLLIESFQNQRSSLASPKVLTIHDYQLQ